MIASWAAPLIGTWTGHTDPGIAQALIAPWGDSGILTAMERGVRTSHTLQHLGPFDGQPQLDQTGAVASELQFTSQTALHAPWVGVGPPSGTGVAVLPGGAVLVGAQGDPVAAG